MSTNKTFNKVQLDVKFTQATTRANLISEENISISFGKISKYFADLHSQAFTGYTHPTYTERPKDIYKFHVNTLGHVDDATALDKTDVSTLINKLDTGSSTPVDADYYISQYVGGGTTTTSYHRRPMSALWSYIKSKADSVYLPIGHTYPLSIAADGGTNQLTLSASTKYKLTAGGSTFVFTTPPNTTYSAGTGLSLSGTTFNHSNSVTAVANYNKPYVKYDAQGHITGSSYWTATAAGTNDESGWIKVATMVHTGTHDNTPIMLLVSQRGNTITYKLHIVWKNTGNTDPDIDKFRLSSDIDTNADAYIKKSTTSTWELYIKKLDNWEAIAMHLYAGKYFPDSMTWTWQDVQTAESAITGGIEAEKIVPYNYYQSRTANTVLAAPNGSNGKASFRKLVATDIPDLDYVSNTQEGMNAAINLLSTGSSTPGLADYYVSQYVNGGTTATSYHRRPISSLWNAFKELITLTTTGSGNAVTDVSIANDGDHNRKIAVTKGSTFSLSTHTHGLLHSDLNQASTNGTTGGWSVIGIDPAVTGYVLKSIRVNTTSPDWLSGDYGAGIAFGGSDTKGVISMKYQSPVITFAGGNHSSSKTEPLWYLKISGTSGSTYNLANFYDSTISRTANTVLAAPDGSAGTATFRKLVAADIPYLNYSGDASVWWNDRDKAVIRLTKADSSYRPLWSLLTSTTGSWAVGNHNNDDLVFNFISKATYDTGANPASNAYKQVKFTNAGGITTTGAITASGTGTFRTDTLGTQLIVERTDGAEMAGITFKNTNGVLGYIAANTVDGDLYHYGATDTSTMKYTILDSHNYTSYPLPRNIKHIHTANGTDGSGGWVKIARITVTEAYADQPMTFTIAQRRIIQYRIHLLFTNSGSAAATEISEFIITRDNSWTDTNNDPRAYIIKPSDGIFDLYIRKTVSWDRIFVVDFTKADDGGGNSYSITWTNVHVADSAITGGTEAVKKLYLPTTTNYAGSSSVGGAATYVNGTLTNPPNEIEYAVPFHTNPTTGSKSLLNNDGISYVCREGTTGDLGFGVLVLGNGVNSGTAGNKYGIVRMYPQTGNYYGQIRPVKKLTNTRTYQLPDASGYVILGIKDTNSNLWGLMDGDGTTSGWIRATSHGFIPSAEARFFQTATSSLGTNTWYFKNSYIQYMNANRLVLGAAKTTDGAAKGQVKFFSGNANDTTGTVTLECVNDLARTGDYTVKLPTWNGTIPVFEKLFEGASNNVSLSFSDINEYDLFLITVANSNATTEQVTVASLWISNIAGVHDMPLIWGGTPSSSGGACNVTSGWIQLTKNSGTTTFNIGHKSNVAQMTSSGWTISSPTYNLYIRKIFGLKAYKRT